MSNWKAKRFWKAATVESVGQAFTVHLDGRAVKTPAKRALTVPTKALAQAIAAEWDAQEDAIDPRSMPNTRSANAAIDKVAVQKAEVVQMLADYGDSDLLCYRADAPDSLVERQTALWDPVLVWAETALNARLVARAGVMHVPQDAAVLARLHGQVSELSHFELAAFHDLVSLSGSLVLGFAAIYDLHPPEALWDLSRLDENWQAEQWGKDEDATELALLKKSEFLHAHCFYTLCQSPNV